MIKKLVIGTFYSVIVFCVVSYLSVMASLFASVGELKLRPVTNIGFPFKYYYQFWVRGNDSPNCGWRFGNFVLDFFITWIVTLIIYNLATRKAKY